MATKNSRQHTLTQNSMPELQLQFFKKINYAVSNENVKYPDEVKGRILPVKLGFVAPYRELAKITPTLIERWNQEVRL